MRPHKPYLPLHPDAPWLLDLYCGAGGASVGYWQAGFNVIGIDIEPQPRYPFTFVQMDALDFLASMKPSPFVAIHASPPCQAFTNAWKIRQNEHPDLVAPTRDHLERIGLPYVIENVEGAPLRDPVTLCGGSFDGLRVYRHRLFETSFDVPEPVHQPHTAKITKMGRPPKPDEFMHVVGHFAGVPQAREAMGIWWMSRNELKEAIPPAYTRYIAPYIPLSRQERAARGLVASLRPVGPLDPQKAARSDFAGTTLDSASESG